MSSAESQLGTDKLQGLADVLQPASPGDPVWVTVGQLFDGSGESTISGAHLVYDALTIRFVGELQRPPPPEVLSPGQTSPDIELPGYTALPGLIDCHTHLFLDGAPVDLDTRKRYLTREPDWLLERARARWRKIMLMGITAVRDAGDKDGVGLALAEECARQRGKVSTYPYIDSPGAAIHRRGRYGRFMGKPLDDFDNLELCVEDRVAAGADRIKLIATGIINFKAGKVTSAPQLTGDEVRELVAASQQRGKQTFAHASGTEGIQNVIDGGVTTVEHGYFVTREQLARMRDNRIGWVPTIAPVQIQIDRAGELGWSGQVVDHLRRIVADHFRMLSTAQDLGTIVMAGSDAGSCGVPHGLGLLRELELMQLAGMSASSVLAGATGLASRLLSFQEPIGRLAEGCRARMIFTRHQPLQKVADLQRDKIVVFDGKALACDAPTDMEGL